MARSRYAPLVTATKRQVACTLEGEAVILHLEDGVYYGLNEVGTRVWQLVQVPRNVEQIVHALVEEFDVQPERCQKDVGAIIAELAARGLVTVHEGAP